MAVSLKQQAIKPLKCLIAMQVLAATVLLLLFFCFSRHTSLSILISGLACVTANMIFIGYLFRDMRPQAAKRIVWNFCFGELLKLVVIAVVMLLAVKYLNILVWPFLLTYFILQLVALFTAPWCWQQGARV